MYRWVYFEEYVLPSNYEGERQDLKPEQLTSCYPHKNVSYCSLSKTEGKGNNKLPGERMSLNEILKEVINRNVKNEELRNIIYKFCTEKNQSIVETEHALVTARCFSGYEIVDSEIFVSILLDNIADEMEHYSDYLSSVMRNLIEMLQANICGTILYLLKRKHAEVAETGLWFLKKI